MVLIKKIYNGRVPNVWVNRSSNLSFSEWERCHFFLLTPHSLERVPAIQIAEKLCPFIFGFYFCFSLLFYLVKFYKLIFYF